MFDSKRVGSRGGRDRDDLLEDNETKRRIVGKSGARLGWILEGSGDRACGGWLDIYRRRQGGAETGGGNEYRNWKRG